MAGLYQGSFIEFVGDVSAATVAIVDTNGNQLSGFDQSRPATSVLTSVASSATSVTILAANPARRQFFIQNASSKNLFLAYAATATSTTYTFLIAANSSFGSDLNGYTGIITGIWSAVNGTAHVTEVST